ncbi:hypothetical protein EHS86_10415 [Erwinia amylovora]|uniref:Uncharacterized protein n=1 Tax=Erwinia amylovora NBRC 12687 = CFBP 1232 TaxID=1219359 RepID=A0A831ETT9_ERWAM|nr:hypothetical protein AD997_11160 [Erwinia amylovora]EKV53539.1 hypothetical protein EaACW_2282 [Erwinia amylovora ACW56400]CCO79127.1 hypothetical protein BN432_2339 [Erwinia amylovora Ea356]CCO82933.1 hypothetical protein BN433_2372 [Erwinia amylovora Ea266]CCO90490.1 hypothetical protein BN435_2330 [Erwinia amylovora 01SFR-BO]CCO94259.1 hypothetical protein BN437_2340 [Erwinia amylovora NBRC 12687 = CFBP 1232]CCO99603.1 hypothetical protein BN438_2330 [Erwinia amylovora UPN527]
MKLFIAHRKPYVGLKTLSGKKVNEGSIYSLTGNAATGCCRFASAVKGGSVRHGGKRNDPHGGAVWA